MIYSPYIILNRSNLNLAISERGNTIELLGRSDEERKITPVMFSFEKHGDTKNRAIIRAEDSIWSQPMSLMLLGNRMKSNYRLRGNKWKLILVSQFQKEKANTI